MEYQFDVNRIIGIKFMPSQVKDYKWLPAKPGNRKFFGLCKTRSYEAGFYVGDYDQHCRTQEWLEGYYEFIVENKIVRSQAFVTVYLESEYQVSAKFKTDQEAEMWIEQLKATSQKTFEIVKHN